MINVYKSPKGMEKVISSYNSLLKQWDTEFTEEDVKTSWGSTHCIITGNREAPPLLLLHGVGDNSAVMWVLNIKELSRNFFCIAVDTLGGPGKSLPNENFNKKSFSQKAWLDEITAHYKLDTFNIAGVSNGAVMAFNYAIKDNGKVNRVVCMEGGMVINPYKAIIRTLGMMFPEILFPTRNNMIRIFKKMSSPDSDTFNKHPEIIDHVILLMKSHNQKAMFVHTIEKYNKAASMAKKDMFYFLIGGHKLEKKKEFINILEEGDYKYKVIEKAGHGINHEQPDIVNQEIISFLTQNKIEQII